MVVVAGVVSACSASIAHRPPPVTRGLDLAQAWPSGAPHAQLEGFGAPQQGRLASSDPVDISAYLAPKHAVVADAKPLRQRAKPQTSVRVIAAEPAAPVVTIVPPLPDSSITLTEESADEGRYTARDQQAQKQKEFRGGDAIVITTGTIVLVLLILLLVLIFT